MNIGIASVMSGTWLIIGSLILNTKNFKSSIVFKVIPFMLGFMSLLYGFKYLNII